MLLTEDQKRMDSGSASDRIRMACMAVGMVGIDTGESETRCWATGKRPSRANITSAMIRRAIRNLFGGVPKLIVQVTRRNHTFHIVVMKPSTHSEAVHLTGSILNLLEGQTLSEGDGRPGFDVPYEPGQEEVEFQCFGCKKPFHAPWDWDPTHYPNCPHCRSGDVGEVSDGGAPAAVGPEARYARPRAGLCSCGAQDRVDHRPHAAWCGVYHAEPALAEGRFEYEVGDVVNGPFGRAEILRIDPPTIKNFNGVVRCKQLDEFNDEVCPGFEFDSNTFQFRGKEIVGHMAEAVSTKHPLILWQDGQRLLRQHLGAAARTSPHGVAMERLRKDIRAGTVTAAGAERTVNDILKAAGVDGSVTAQVEANDTLSRAISEIRSNAMAHEEASHHDAGFDAGEFSGPAHAEAEAEEAEAIARKHGFASYGDLLTHASSRLSAKWVHQNMPSYARDEYEHDSVHGRRTNESLADVILRGTLVECDDLIAELQQRGIGKYVDNGDGSLRKVSGPGADRITYDASTGKPTSNVWGSESDVWETLRMIENCVRAPVTSSASSLGRYLSASSVAKVLKLKPGKKIRARGIDNCELRVTNMQRGSAGSKSYRIEPV